MNILTDRQAISRLTGILDSALAQSARKATHVCISWLTGMPSLPSANEPSYGPNPEAPRAYRKSVKKGAVVRTIHSILSKRCQNVLSEEIGSQAAWLLGLWPKLTQPPWCQNAHPLTIL